MSATESELKAQTGQIRDAAKLAFDDSKYFGPVFDTIAAISTAQEPDNLRLQLPCIDFFYRAYCSQLIKSFELRYKESTKLIPVLSRLLLPPKSVDHHRWTPDYALTEKCINILASSYDLMFYSLIKDPKKELWDNLNDLTNYLVSQWPSSYPLLPYNPDSDWSRAMSCKNALMILLGKMVQTHLPPPHKTTTKDDPDKLDISVALVTKDHPFLYNSKIGNQGRTMMNKLFSLIDEDILLPTAVFSTYITVMMTLFRLRPNYVSTKFLAFILGYESKMKKKPKYETNKLKIKLNQRFNDRLDKIVISLLLNRGFIDKDPSLRARFENKLNFLVEQGNILKRRGLVLDDEDEDQQPAKKRRKISPNTQEKPIDFYNESPIARSDNYKSIYSLLKPGDDLESFNMSSINSNLLSKMVMTAMAKVESRKLVHAMNIVADRYCEIVTRNDYDAEHIAVKKEANVEENEDDQQPLEDEEVYSLPLPKTLSMKQKKAQVKLIVDNFIKLGNQNGTDHVEESAIDDLGKVAISNWKSDSWIKILCRLATRGTNLNSDLSDYIRDNLFKYFEGDIKERLPGVIEWLNEEYYSEIVKEENAKKETGKPVDNPHKTYLLYAGKVLDTLIPFLDASDRKIFIRLLSELPYLNSDLISKIHSICFDPARSKLGFQSLLYLIMFRPPAFQSCIDLLKSMHKEATEKDNEPLVQSCMKLLTKYDKKEFPPKK